MVSTLSSWQKTLIAAGLAVEDTSKREKSKK
jgi:hypothetical protein